MANAQNFLDLCSFHDRSETCIKFSKESDQNLHKCILHYKTKNQCEHYCLIQIPFYLIDVINYRSLSPVDHSYLHQHSLLKKMQP